MPISWLRRCSMREHPFRLWVNRSVQPLDFGPELNGLQQRWDRSWSCCGLRRYPATILKARRTLSRLERLLTRVDTALLTTPSSRMVTESPSAGTSTEIRRPKSSDGEECSNVIPRPSIEMSMTRHARVGNSPWIWQLPSQLADWRGTLRRCFMMSSPSLDGSREAFCNGCHNPMAMACWSINSRRSTG